MSPSTPTDFRALIVELLAIWDDALATRKTTKTRGDLHDPRVPVIVRGLAAHAVDCARGVLTLYQNRQTVSAIPIVRALMEDAITAAWVYAKEDAWRSFAVDGATNRAKALRHLSRSDPDDLVAVEQLKLSEELIDDLGKPSGHSIEQRMAAFKGTENWYLMYRAASLLTHAGSSVVDLYLEANDAVESGVSFRNHASHSNASAYIAVGATNLLHTLLVWDLCQTDRPDQEHLEQIMDRLELHIEFKLRDA